MSFKVLPALKDTYLTDRYINGVSQVAANVGNAGSLDLYKLYGLTSTVTGTIRLPNTETTRLLIQFDLSSLRKAVAIGLIDPSSPSFNCKLHLHDVYGGQPNPNNFTVTVYPLSASFDEGLGKDVVFYSDSDTSNWLTGSIVGGAWFATGCGMGGDNGAPCDYLTASSGTNLKASQFFITGEEDLDVDVTTVISATLAGLIPDQGFRISFDAALETDQHTYFVKRFASRTAYNDDLHPKLYVRYDDSIQDDTDNVFLDSTSYLFFYNYVRSSPANLMSGSSPVTGNDCVALRFVGAFPKAALAVVSSSTCLAPSGPFTFGQPSSVLFAGTGNFSYVTQSVVNAQAGNFTFGQISTGNTGSNIAFTGFYSGTLSGLTGSASDLLLVGQATGTYVSPVNFGVMSGDYYYAHGNSPSGWDINTPIIVGTAVFTGTIEGLGPTVDTYYLSGTFAPAAITSPQEMPYLYSGSYVVSATIVNSSSSGAQLVGQLTGKYSTLEPFVPVGTFYLPDGITPVLTGTAFFTGTLDGITDNYVLTGTFVPDGGYLFSASHITSQTLGPVPFSTSPVLGSQLAFGNSFQTGIYSASVLLASTDPDLRPQWASSGSVTLTPIWTSPDGTVTYLTGSDIKVYPPQRGAQSIDPRKFEVTVLGLRDRLASDEQTTLRVNIFDYTVSYLIQSVRLPVERPGMVVRDVHYQIRDSITKRVAVPFDTTYNSTRVSNDSAGMYFKLDTSNLTPGRTYVVDVMIVTGNNKQLYEGASPAFRVDDTA